MFEKLSEFLFGGTRGFNEAEAHLLSFVVKSLPPQDGNILRCQIQSVRKVQRQNPGKLVVAFYKERQNVPTLPYHGYEYCLANVTYKSHGRSKTTSLVLHNGRFMTFERNVPQTLADIDTIQSIVLHPKAFSGVAQEINSEEHGQGSA